jgi:hypothetical protein
MNSEDYLRLRELAYQALAEGWHLWELPLYLAGEARKRGVSSAELRALLKAMGLYER